MGDVVFPRIENAKTRTWDGDHCDLCRASPSRSRLEDRQFCLMQRGFRSTGGLLGGDELANLLRETSGQPISVLARWIVTRQAVSFEWHGQTLLPLFQFELSDMSLRSGVSRVVGELADVFDNWEMALWFAQPNAWLGDSAPADVVGIDARAVFDAARADRFVALG